MRPLHLILALGLITLFLAEPIASRRLEIPKEAEELSTKMDIADSQRIRVKRQLLLPLPLPAKIGLVWVNVLKYFQNQLLQQYARFLAFVRTVAFST